MMTRGEQPTSTSISMLIEHSNLRPQRTVGGGYVVIDSSAR